MSDTLDRLEEALGHHFADRTLLERALVHASARSESGVSDNETFEFLGDAALDLALSELLMAAHPDFNEGRLTRTRAAFVNAAGLAERARRLDLGSHLVLGKGERKSGGDQKESILAACFEAVLGAVFLDGGYERCREVVGSHFNDAIEDPGSASEDFKTTLQEFTQKRHKRTPCYRVVDVSGPDHDREYEVEALLEGKTLAKGRGKSRKQAEQQAAREAGLALGALKAE